MTCEDLIERLKKLLEADRQCDILIAKLVGYTVQDNARVIKTVDGRERREAQWYDLSGRAITRVPFFTLKLDEALILSKIARENGAGAVAYRFGVWLARLEDGEIHEGKTAAIALCIAALSVWETR